MTKQELIDRLHDLECPYDAEVMVQGIATESPRPIEESIMVTRHESGRCEVVLRGVYQGRSSHRFRFDFSGLV